MRKIPYPRLQLIIAIVMVFAAFWLLQKYSPFLKDIGGSGLQASVFDYSQITDVKQKKRLFFDTLRPIVQRENQRLAELRSRLTQVPQDDRDDAWVVEVADRYGIDDFDSKKDWRELLRRVDIVPVELVLAQAAMESGWGESRFAQQGNNLFGQWCFTKGCGIVPSQRARDASHEVRKFDSINDALAAYMHNLNTGHAYDILRTLRARLRFRNQPIDGDTLAGGLIRYSERGAYYVMEIRSVMRINKGLIMGSQP